MIMDISILFDFMNNILLILKAEKGSLMLH